MCVHYCKCISIDFDHPCYLLCLENLWISFKTQPSTSTYCLMQPHTFPLPPSLPPGAPRQRAQRSRAVCGGSDIHLMQWIIYEHHLVHTTGEHNSNRLLWDGFFYSSAHIILHHLLLVPSFSLSLFSHTHLHRYWLASYHCLFISIYM